MHGNDSVKNTVIVATLLCLLCSIMVSVAAVKLKPFQEANKVLDIQKNLLLAAGLIEADATRSQVEEAYRMVTPHMVDLQSGTLEDDAAFDLKSALSSSTASHLIPKMLDKAGIIRQANKAKIYTVSKDGEVTHYIFPIYGKGLWSTLYGFFVLAPDFNTVKGIGFYEHGETPGLGGEVDNVKWKHGWIGKKVYRENSEQVAISVIKGVVDQTLPDSIHQIDGLSGATLTSKGVSNLVQFWLGENGFLPFIKAQLAKEAR